MQLAVHVPPWQVPMIIVPTLHELPFAVAVWTHPACESQLSSVHPLPSSQSRMVPARQLPFTHWSPTVHTLPSSHIDWLFVWTHPVIGSQVSSVHGL